MRTISHQLTCSNDHLELTVGPSISTFVTTSSVKKLNVVLFSVARTEHVSCLPIDMLWHITADCPVCCVIPMPDIPFLQEASEYVTLILALAILWLFLRASAFSLILISGDQSSQGAWIQAGSGVIVIESFGWRCFW